MTTRRRFIQSLVTLPPVLSLPGWAADSDAQRVALVIGNGAYPNAPLLNPCNDANAMAGLFTQAGFTVSSHLDATRGEMIAAVEKFGAAVRRPATKQAIFYYAGHGVQLDWRNYLAPIDAKVESAEQLRQHCVDLGLLLRELGTVRDKTLIVILDACRDNPFGDAYRPQQSGLAQFDAPAGSLLAYATSPGKGAADDSGSGRNGLYTENLLRELSLRSARIEDALKRVRLSVRLASRGTQVPWETTSLESDVYLFNDGQRKLSDVELEKQIEADLAAWNRIKGSRDVNEWLGYMRAFPSGRFAEIAQTRIARMQEEAERAAALRAEAAKAVLAASTPTTAVKLQAAPAAVALELGNGKEVPQRLRLSANPYSAGFYPLGRKYSVGDEATFRESDFLTGLETRVYTNRVTRVDIEADRVEINRGVGIIDLMGNPLKTGKREFDVPRQQNPAELQVGKKWAAVFTMILQGSQPNTISIDYNIASRERVSVPAGTFDAFRIEGWGWSARHGTRIEFRQWLVPWLNFPVKREVVHRHSNGQFKETERHELVSLRQHVFGD